MRDEAMTKVEAIAVDAAQAMTERFGTRISAGEAKQAVSAAMAGKN